MKVKGAVPRWARARLQACQSKGSQAVQSLSACKSASLPSRPCRMAAVTCDRLRAALTWLPASSYMYSPFPAPVDETPAYCFSFQPLNIPAACSFSRRRISPTIPPSRHSPPIWTFLRLYDECRPSDEPRCLTLCSTNLLYDTVTVRSRR